MEALNGGVLFVIRSFDRRLVRLAVIGAAVGALALGGCGRKGALDPPPSASISNNQPVAPPPPSLGEQSDPGFLTGLSSPREPPPQAAPPAGSAAQTAEKKGFLLDWLLK